MSVVLSTLGALLTLPWVGLYWLYTLAGWRVGRGLLRRWRRGSMRLGALVALAGPMWALYRGEADLLPLVGVLAGVSVLALLNARTRQWLVPRPAPLLVPVEVEVAPQTPVAVLSEGAAIPLPWLAKLRTARRRETVLVHCALSRSLMAVHSEDYAPIAAVLPHATGFEIGANGCYWDGVTGQTLDGGESLSRVPVAVCSHAAWRAAHPDEPLLAPAGGPPSPSRKRRVLLPAARNVDDGQRLGRVNDDRWRALESAELARCDPFDEPVYYLSRWAAIARGLVDVERSN